MKIFIVEDDLICRKTLKRILASVPGAEVIEAGWRQATMGVECDHIGWSTEVRLADALDGEWRRWCAENGVIAGAKPMRARMVRREIIPRSQPFYRLPW